MIGEVFNTMMFFLEVQRYAIFLNSLYPSFEEIQVCV